MLYIVVSFFLSQIISILETAASHMHYLLQIFLYLTHTHMTPHPHIILYIPVFFYLLPLFTVFYCLRPFCIPCCTVPIIHVHTPDSVLFLHTCEGPLYHFSLFCYMPGLPFLHCPHSYTPATTCPLTAFLFYTPHMLPPAHLHCLQFICDLLLGQCDHSYAAGRTDSTLHGTPFTPRTRFALHTHARTPPHKIPVPAALTLPTHTHAVSPYPPPLFGGQGLHASSGR